MRRVKVSLPDITLEYLLETCTCPAIMGRWNLKLISADLERAKRMPPAKRAVYPETINYMLSELTAVLLDVEQAEEPCRQP